MNNLLEKLEELSLKYNWNKVFQNQSTLKPSSSSSISSSSNSNSINISTPKKQLINKSFSKIKENLTKEYFNLFNKLAFNNVLPKDLLIIWNKRLTKTAGYTKMKRNNLSEIPRTAMIELSTKVIDDEERLKQTLIHELCHVATWLIDGVSEPAHGEDFWKWAKHAENTIPGIKVSRCHSYEINAPYKFICTNEICQKIYSRHSKKGLDTSKYVCGSCRSTIIFQGVYNPDGTPKKKRELNGFSLYVQQNYQQVKKEFSHLTHKEIMNVLSQRYRGDNVTLQSKINEELNDDNYNCNNNKQQQQQQQQQQQDDDDEIETQKTQEENYNEIGDNDSNSDEDNNVNNQLFGIIQYNKTSKSTPSCIFIEIE